MLESIQENNIELRDAVSKVARVIEDTCIEYEQKGHPYYSKYLREAFQKIIKGVEHG